MLDAERRKRYLEAMGVRVFVRRDDQPGAAGIRVAERPRYNASEAPAADAGCEAPRTVPAVNVETASPSPGPGVEPAGKSRQEVGDDWTTLKRQVAECTACALHESRTQTVFGVGNEQAALMVIGEAPGADEDRQGEPFVGRAGQLLTAMLGAIGLQRRDVYIANILKCRPPGNRNPTPAEAVCCLPFLERQIDLVAPRLILAVGAVAAHHLLDSDESVGRLRGQVHTYGASRVPLIVSYHPAYLLRQPAEKAKAWQDLQKVRGILEGA